MFGFYCWRELIQGAALLERTGVKFGTWKTSPYDECQVPVLKSSALSSQKFWTWATDCYWLGGKPLILVSQEMQTDDSTSSAAVYPLHIIFILTACGRGYKDENIRCKILAGCCCITAGIKKACYIWRRSCKK